MISFIEKPNRTLYESQGYNDYISILGQYVQYFMNRHYIWPHSRKMYPKFTCIRNYSAISPEKYTMYKLGKLKSHDKNMAA